MLPSMRPDALTSLNPVPLSQPTNAIEPVAQPEVISPAVSTTPSKEEEDPSRSKTRVSGSDPDPKATATGVCKLLDGDEPAKSVTKPSLANLVEGFSKQVEVLDESRSEMVSPIPSLGRLSPSWTDPAKFRDTQPSRTCSPLPSSEPLTDGESSDGMSLDYDSYDGRRSVMDYSDGDSLPEMGDLQLHSNLAHEPPSTIGKFESAQHKDQDSGLDDDIILLETSSDEGPPSKGSPSDCGANSAEQRPKRKRLDASSGDSAEESSSSNRQLSAPSSGKKKVSKVAHPTGSEVPSSGPVGISKTAKRNSAMKAKEAAGKLIVNQRQLNKFLNKLKEGPLGDKFACPWPGDETGHKFRHSKCGKPVTISYLYETKNWNDHVKDCKGLAKNKKESATAGMRNMETYMVSKRRVEQPRVVAVAHRPSVTVEPVLKTVPCPGLSEESPGLESDQVFKLNRYVRLPGADGGGGRAPEKVAEEMYGVTSLKDLKDSQRRRVVAAQALEWQWTLIRGLTIEEGGYVRSTNCLKVVNIRVEQDVDITPPCKNCLDLLHLQQFQVALNRTGPKSDETYKFVNRAYRNEPLAELYAKFRGLKEIFQATKAVSTTCHFDHRGLF